MVEKTVSRGALNKAILRNDRMATFDLTPTRHNGVDGYVDAIKGLWNRAQEHFLAIGKNLRLLKEQFPGEYEDVIRRRLPFSPSVARQLKAVADNVISGRLAETDLPRSYSTAYQITSLSDDELHEARIRALVRPDVTRREIMEFKESIRVETRDDTAVRRALVMERKRLLVRLSEIDRQLAGMASPMIEGTATTLPDAAD